MSDHVDRCEVLVHLYLISLMMTKTCQNTCRGFQYMLRMYLLRAFVGVNNIIATFMSVDEEAQITFL
jgi:hypothetical protein